jgi:hypothetical protein
VRAVFFQPGAGANTWTVVARTPLETTTPSASTFPTRVPVHAGDRLGLSSPTPVQCAAASGSGQDRAPYDFDADPVVGATMTEDGALSPALLNVAATVETDADGDGYGDVSQDPCPTAAGVGGPCPASPPTPLAPSPSPTAPDTRAPDTSFVRKPLAELHKKRAVFDFTADEPGSRFECSIDGSAYVACSPPRRRAFGPGRHVFKVRAIDPAGNVDPTPAAVRWRFVPLNP